MTNLLPKDEESPTTPISLSMTQTTRGDFPLDCMGQILLHFDQCRDFMLFFTLCKNMNYYIMNINPHCCHNVQFKVQPVEKYDSKDEYVESFHIKERVTYVYNLYIHQLARTRYIIDNLKKFPNVKNLEIVNWGNVGLKDDIFVNFPWLEKLRMDFCEDITGCEFPKMKKLKSVKIEGNYNWPNEMFDNLKKSNVKELMVRDNYEKNFDESGFGKLTQLESLHLERCYEFTDKTIQFLFNLKKLVILNCNKIKGECFKNLKNIEKIEIRQNDSQSNITTEHLCYLDKLEEIFLWKCSNVNDGIFSKLNLLKTIKLVECTNIKGEGIDKLPLLESITCDSCRSFGAESMKSDSLREMRLQYSPINDVALGSLKGLEKLELYFCNSVEGSVGGLTSLKTLMLNYDEKLTDNVYKDSDKLEVISVWNCPKISGKYFRNLTALKYVEIYNNENVTGETFGSFNNVEQMVLYNCPNIGNIGFSKTKKLYYLEINVNKKVDDLIFEGCTLLQKLILIGCDNIQGSGFKELDSLTSLQVLHNSHITNEHIESLKSIELLDIRQCQKVDKVKLVEQLFSEDDRAPYTHFLRRFQLNDEVIYLNHKVLNYFPDDKDREAIMKHLSKTVQK